jgi:hypothetical protein
MVLASRDIIDKKTVNHLALVRHAAFACILPAMPSGRLRLQKSG